MRTKAVQGKGRIVVTRKAGAENTVVQGHPGAELFFDFPIENAKIQAHGYDLIVECHDGYIVYLLGVLDDKRAPTLLLKNGTVYHSDTILETLANIPEGHDNTHFAPLPITLLHGQSTASTGSSSSGAVFSTGLPSYSPKPGKLVDSLDRLPDQGTDAWKDTKPHVQFPNATQPESHVVGPQAPPTVHLQLEYIDGASYPALRTVMEDDPYGIQIQISLSTPPVAGDTLTLTISGTAAMGTSGTPGSVADDYAHWKFWKIVLPDGTIHTGDALITQVGTALQITLPVGAATFGIVVPLFDNDISNPDRTFIYKVENSGRYILDSPYTDTILIVDEDRLQDFYPGMPLPQPGVDLPDIWHSAPGRSRPLALIEVWDDTHWSLDTTVNENSTAALQYRFRLVNQKNGADYTALEDIRVTVAVTGKNGLVLNGTGQDVSLPDSTFLNAFTSKYPDAVYDVTTGKLTFTIPAGSTSNEVLFSGTPIGDFLVEQNANGSLETIRFDVIKVQGNEALRGTGAATFLRDVPAISVLASTTDIFESADHPTLSNQVTFTFTLTSPALTNLNVQLGWDYDSGKITTGDYQYSLDGGITFTSGPLPTSLALSQGSTSGTIIVKTVDDALSEGAETLKLKILPQDGISDKLSDDYHLATTPGTGVTGATDATVVIHDDTDVTYGNNGAHLDGPAVIITATDAAVGGSALSSISEINGVAFYHLKLMDPANQGISYSGERQQMTVELQAVGKDGAALTGVAAKDIDFELVSPADVTWSYNEATGKITLTIPAKDSGSVNITEVVFKGTAIPDSRMEVPQSGPDMGKQESVGITITNVSGNESRIGTNNSVDTTILDAPTAYVTVDVAKIFESDAANTLGPSGTALGNTATFTVTLTSPALADTTVQIAFTDANTTNPGEFKYSTDNGGTWSTTAPTTVTINKNGTAATIKVQAIDDALTEGDFNLTLAVKPNNGSTDVATDLYHASTGADKSTSVLVLDDTTPGAWSGGTNPHLDGPAVIITATDAAVGGSALSSISEINGVAFYHLKLMDPANQGISYSGERQQMTVELQAVGKDGAALTGVAAKDIDFELVSPADVTWSYNEATGKITLTIPAKDSGSVNITEVVFKGTAIPDSRMEVPQSGPDMGKQESVGITITNVSGNESRIGTNNSVDTTILDAPTAYVTVDVAKIFESDAANTLGPSGTALGNTATFTVTLTSPALADTTVQIAFTDANTTNPGGFKYSTDNGGTWSTTAPTTVTINKNGTAATIKVQAIDDALTEGDFNLTLAVKPNNGSTDVATDLYHASTGADKSTSVLVLDDTTPGAWSGGTNPHLDGPAVIITATDAAVGGSALSSISEINGVAFYHLKLMDPANQGISYSGERQQMTVELQAVGKDGAALTGVAAKDIDFELVSPADVTWSYNEATGKITLTIPAKDSGSVNITEVVFKGTAIPDSRMEVPQSGPDMGKQESVGITITNVSGNESRIGTNNSVDTTILDAPTAYVTVDVAKIFESDAANTLGPSGTALGNTATFTVTLTSPALADTTVQIAFTDANTTNPGGFKYSTDNGGTWSTTAPTTVTINKNGTAATIKVQAIDDALTEGDFNLTLAVKPNNGSTDVATDLYHASTGADKSTSVLVLDDTTPGAWSGGTNPHLDGPIVRVVLTDKLGNPLRDAEGQHKTDYGMLEKANEVTYKVLLLNADGTPYTGEREDISVTLNFEALKGTKPPYNYTNILYEDGPTYLSGTDPSIQNIVDFCFYDLARLQNYVNNGNGSITFTIPSGSSFVEIKGKIYADTVMDEEGEGVNIAVTNVVGNEAIPGPTISTEFMDTPVLGVSAAPYFSESGSALTFTITMSVPFYDYDPLVTGVWVRVKIGDSGDGAEYGVDYTRPPADGTTIKHEGTDAIWVKVPLGFGTYDFTLPITDDALAEGLETVTVTLVPPDGSTSATTDEYRISTGTDNSVTTTIVDDTLAWLPGYGTEPAGHGVLDGPEVRIAITDASGTELTGADAAKVMENGGPVYYKLYLVDQGTNTPYSGTDHQDITVSLQATGLSGAQLSAGATQDYTFANGTGGTGWNYDPGTGKITVTIPSGSTNILFTGQPKADKLPEAVNNGDGTWTQEKVKIDITTVSGNEAVLDTKTNVTTEIIDVPTVSIEAGARYYSESQTTPGTDNKMSFTVSLSSPSLEATAVDLDWSGTATAGTDYAGYPATITIPAGQTSYTFTVPIKDDALTENNETVIVALKPQGGTAADTNDYHISGTKGSTTTTIIDDTKPWPSDGGTAPGYHGVLDGPEVRLAVTDASGTELTGADAANVMENGGPVYYKLYLVDQGTNTPYSGTDHQDITVSLQATGLSGAQLSAGATQDYTFANGTGGTGWNYDPATGKITVTIPSGSTNILFTGQPKADKLPEAQFDNESGKWVNEQVQVTITKVEGNEASVDAASKTASTDIIDVPEVSVARDVPVMFESLKGNNGADNPVGADGYPLPNHATFTFTLSSPSPNGVTVKLNWGSSTVDSGDYTAQKHDAVSGTTSLGSTLPGTITFPPGQTTVTITVTAKDDIKTEDIEYFQVTISPETTGDTTSNNYHVKPGAGSAEVALWDDSYVMQKHGQTYLDGPIAMLVYCDSAGSITLEADSSSPNFNKPVTVATIHENQPGNVYYKVALFEASADGTLKVVGGKYVETTATEKIEVTIDAQGFDANTILKTTESGKDFGFTTGGANNITWANDADKTNQGTIKLEIQNGSKGTVFSGKPVADKSVEGEESFTLAITGVKGNEARYVEGGELTTTIMDIPTVSIVADHKYYSESDATTMTFTVKLTSAADYDILVDLAWTTGTGYAKAGTSASAGADFALVDKIKIPAGQTEVQLRVPVFQDDLTEGPEIAEVTIKGYGPSGNPYPVDAPYHIDHTKQTAKSIIVDNPDPWPTDPEAGNPPPEHGAVQGPRIIIKAVDDGNTVNDYSDDRNPKVFEKTGSPGKIRYEVSLEDVDGDAYGAAKQDITVSFKISTTGGIGTGPGESGAWYGHKAGLSTTEADDQGDFWFDMAALQASHPGATFERIPNSELTAEEIASGNFYGRLTVTIPAGTSSFMLDAYIVDDQLTEQGRILYDQFGEPIGSRPDETFTISVERATGNEAIGHETKGSITTDITEVHEGIQVGIRKQTTDDIKEGTDAMFVVELSKAADEDVVVILRPMSSADIRAKVPGYNDPDTHALADDKDFAGATLRVVIPKGQTSVTVPIEVYNDTFSEGKEYMVMEIRDVIGGEAVINPSRPYAVGSIVDDMNGPVVAFDPANCTVIANEGAGNNVDGEIKYRVALSKEPSEDMDITFKIAGLSPGADPAEDFAWPNGSPTLAELTALMQLPAGVMLISLDPGTNTFTVRIDHTLWGNRGSFDFSLWLKDDKLTEEQETFSLTITTVKGSESTIATSNDSVTTDVIDDSARIHTDRDADRAHDNAILDGPYVHLEGTRYISESAAAGATPAEHLAHYRVFLTDPDTGLPYNSDEAITVTLTYKVAGGDEYGNAVAGNEYEIITTTVTIPKGQNYAEFAVRIVDTEVADPSARFEVSISNVVGNEARLPVDTAETSVTTVIVSDTEPWKPEYGFNNGFEVINPGDRHKENPEDNASLYDGPAITLGGTIAIWENIGTVEYTFTMPKAPSEDVTVTMKLSMVFNTQLEDFFNPKAVNDGPDLTLADITKELQTANPLTGVTNVRYIDAGDPQKGVLFDFTIQEGTAFTKLQLPIYNDDLTEHDPNLSDLPKYNLAIQSLEGSEARIANPAGISTTIRDEYLGPPVSLTAWDHDADRWVRDATIISDPRKQEPHYTDNNKLTEYDPKNYTVFKANIGKDAQELLEVTIILRDSANKPMNVNRLDPDLYPDILTNDGILLTAEAQGITVNQVQPDIGDSSTWYYTYTFTIPEGGREATIYFPKITHPINPTINVEVAPGEFELLPQFAGERYTGEIVSVKGCEAQIASGNYATVEIIPHYEPGPWTYISMKCVDPKVENQEASDKHFYTKEGNTAHFALTITGSDEQGMRHDGGATLAAQDGFTDYPITVKLVIDNQYGTSITDFGGLNNTHGTAIQDILDAIQAKNNGTLLVDDGSGNAITGGSLSGFTWDPASKTLSFTIPAGAYYRDIDASGKPFVDIPFSLPVATDNYKEGTDHYDIFITGATSSSVNTTKIEMAILDDFTGPTISLLHADGTDTVVEGIGAAKRYYFEMTEKMESGFTVTLEYLNGTAEDGKDFVGNPLVYSFGSGTAGPGWVEEGGKYRYYFNVSIIDDKLSEPDETFKVRIKGVSDPTLAVDNTQREVTTIIKDDGNSGPLVYFNEATAEVYEDTTTIKFNITLSAKAEEKVTVYLTLEDITTTIGQDYTLTGLPGYLGIVDGKHMFKVEIPKGTIQVPLNLSGMLINDRITEGTEQFKLEIVKVEGGEARIQDGSGSNHGGSGNGKNQLVVDVHDSDNGPQVSVVGSETDIVENPIRTPGPDEVSFTFSIAAASAEQDIVITFWVETLRGTLDGLFDTPGTASNLSGVNFVRFGTTADGRKYEILQVTIPKGQNSVTWTAPKLTNDDVDERTPKDSFQVIIKNVEGHEAQIGSGNKAVVTVTDDDHAPVTTPDNILIMLTPGQANGGIAKNVNVLVNDTDADNPGNTNAGLSTKTGTLTGRYGNYVIDTDGSLIYTVDHNNAAIKNLTSGQKLGEDAFTYVATDGSNPVNGTVNVDIRATNNLTGTGADEWIFGSAQNDTIKGGGGYDVIHAGAGDDFIYDAGDGKGKLYGDEGSDTFVFTPKGGVVNLADMAQVIDGGTGVDRLTIDPASSHAHFNFTGNGWNTKINSVEIIDISGKTGTSDNWISIDAAAVLSLTSTMGPEETILKIDGQIGDRFTFTEAGWTAGASSGGYTLYTGPGGAQVHINDNLAFIVEGTSGADAIDKSAPEAGTGNYAIYGGAGDDALKGGAGNDQLYGGDGKDTLDGGMGTEDQLYGGAGKDLLIIRDTNTSGSITSADFRTMDGGEGIDTLQVDGGTTGTLLDFTNIAAGQVKGIEYIDLTNYSGGVAKNTVLLSEKAFADLATSAEGGALYITGTPGNMYELCGDEGIGTPGHWQYEGKVTVGSDEYYKYTSNGKELYVSTALTRVITGTNSAETIHGGDEDSIIIKGLGGNDTIIGGDGNQRIEVGGGENNVTGGDGNDTIIGGNGGDTIRGGDGANLIQGGDGADLIYNDSAGDSLYGGAGNDTFILRDHDGDATIGSSDVALISGGDGIDVVWFEGTNKTLDLTGVGNTDLRGIETFDISGSGGKNHVVIDSSSLLSMNAAGNLSTAQPEIHITGKAGDTFELQGDWVFQGHVSDSPTGWLTYKSPDNNVIWIQETLQRKYVGDAGDDTFKVDNVYTTDDQNNRPTITVKDFAMANGGGGTNTMVLGDGLSGAIIDFTDLTNGQLTDIHVISLKNNGANHIRLNLESLDATGSAKKLTITGDSDDTYEIGAGWTYTGLDGSSTHHVYTNEYGHTLQVEKIMGRVLIGTEGVNTFILQDLSGDGKISGADFALIDGLTGTDTIQVDTGITEIDLRGLAAGQIKNIEVVNLTGSCSTIQLDQNTLSNMGFAATPASHLLVHGDASGKFVLQGSGWTFQPSKREGEKDYLVYRDTTGRDVYIQQGMTRDYVGTVGNDTFILDDIYGNNGTISAADFNTIKGNGGNDVIQLAKNNDILDLSALPGGVISGIATINLGSTTNNTVILDGSTITNMGLSTLTIHGNSTDSFELQGTWILIASDSSSYSYQDSNGKTVIIDVAMKHVISGTDGADDMHTFTDKDFIAAGDGADTITIHAKPTNGSGTVNGADFGRIDGGAGTDVLRVDSNLNLDLTSLGTNKITGVEIIDMAGSTGGNKVTLDANTLTNMGQDTLTITGDASDSFELKGTGWGYVSTDSGYHTYTDVSGHTLNVSAGMQHIINGTSGVDTLHSHTDMDMIYAGADDDVIILHSKLGDDNATVITGADFGKIDGGAGIDSITIGKSGMNLDLTGLAADQITDVETIDLTGAGDNKLTINATTFTGMGRTTLTVNGDNGDTLALDNSWTFIGTASGYNTYTAGANTLQVATSITRVISGTPGNDIFTLHDENNDGTITAAEISSIIGNGGTDVLGLGGNGKDLDLTGLAADQITDVEIIDLTGAGDNKLTINATTFTGMGRTTLTVNGDTTDMLVLDTSWHKNGDSTYTDGTNTVTVTGPSVAITGTAGNDTFTLYDSANAADIGTITAAEIGTLIGSGGSDKLMLDGTSTNLHLDLTGMTANQISGVDTIDLTGAGDNKLTINATTFTGMGKTTLTVNGDNGDTLALDNSWTFIGTASGYNTYTAGANTLQVATSITRVISGTPGNDIFTLHDENNDGTITAAEISSIIGNGGTDVLKVTNDNLTIDLTGLSPGQIKDIALIDVADADYNLLKISAATFAGMGDISELTIHGNATDTLDLYGNWSYDADSSKYVISGGGGLVVTGSMTLAIHAESAGTIHAGPENTIIYGSTGNDLLSGGTGNDTLYGGGGNDTVTGGGGADIFIWNKGDATAIGQITDFTLDDDKLCLEGLLSEAPDIPTLTALLQGGTIDVTAVGLGNDQATISVNSGPSIDVHLTSTYNMSDFANSNATIAEAAKVEFLMHVLTHFGG